MKSLDSRGELLGLQTLHLLVSGISLKTEIKFKSENEHVKLSKRAGAGPESKLARECGEPRREPVEGDQPGRHSALVAPVQLEEQARPCYESLPKRPGTEGLASKLQCHP